MGDSARARSILGSIDTADAAFSSGLVQAAIGDVDAAFAAFRAVDDSGSFATEHLRYFFPDALRQVRRDPRHEPLIRSVNRAWGLNPDGSLPER